MTTQRRDARAEGASGQFMTDADLREAYGIDIVTAETIRASLIQVTRHMHDTLNRSAFSNVVRENLDMGVALHLITEDGSEQVAITEGACHFAFTHQHMTNMVFDEWGLDNLGPGDTLICNDNWRGSIHFPDVNLFRPIFWEGEPLFALSDASHILDIGGPVPGGFNNEARTFFEEGLRIPPMLILSGDTPVRSTINLLLENTRMPMHNLGDLRALFGTMRVGETRLRVLLERFGPEAVRAASRYTLDLAERRMRRAIEDIPDGEYTADDCLDDGGIGGPSVRLVATATVRGNSVEIDYSGTDRQTEGAATTCWEETNRCLIGPKLILDPRHPMNAGAARPFHVIAPPGSVVMGLPPTSASQHCEIAAKVSALMTNIFGQMMPERAIASESATTHVYIIGGVDERAAREGAPFGAVIAGGGAWGGTPVSDGISFCVTPIFNIADNVIELLERDNPVLIRSRNLVADSAGAGAFRSGYTTTVLLECVAEQSVAYFTALLGSGRTARRGIRGGGDGMTSYLFKVPAKEDHSICQLGGMLPLSDLVPLAGKFDGDGSPDSRDGEWMTTNGAKTLMVTNYPLESGDGVYLVCAAGGGYGSPLARDVDLVCRDVWNEKVSIDFARRAYGVILDPETLAADRDATERLRKELRHREESGDWRPPVGGVPTPWPVDRDALVERYSTRSRTNGDHEGGTS